MFCILQSKPKVLSKGKTKGRSKSSKEADTALTLTQMVRKATGNDDAGDKVKSYQFTWSSRRIDSITCKYRQICHLSTFSKIFPECTWLIKANFHVELSGDGRMKFLSDGSTSSRKIAIRAANCLSKTL